MKRRTILFRLFQLFIILIMLVMVIATAVFCIYAYFFSKNTEEVFPDSTDYLNMLFSTLASILVGFYFSLRFTKRLSPPLSSIATAARTIAEGDLSARAHSSGNDLIELDSMVRDFNLMAERLEVMSKDMQVWNATIAHELRTPVTVLRANLQAVLDDVIEPNKEHSAMLLSQTDNLVSIIDDLRIVSLAETGQIKLYREFSSVYEILQEVEKSLYHEFLKNNKKLRLKVKETTGYVDVMRLKQAILALLHNALQYADNGVIQLSCGYEGKELFISVEDQGPGIPEQFRSKIFEPFYRTDEAQRMIRNSSGLGLSVVKVIAAAHGGYVQCEASSLGGTMFKMVIPNIT